MPDPTIALGLIVGLIVGAFGGGGAILTVPILVYLVGMGTAEATASSLIIVAATSVAGLGAHARKRRVRWSEGIIFGLLGVAGAWLGSKLSVLVAEPVLLGLLTFVMLAVATLMVIQNRRPAPCSVTEPASAPTEQATMGTRLVKVILAATVVGLITGFFGVGGGWAVVPALTLALGFSTAEAVGTSLLVMVLNASTALLTRFSTEGVHLDLALVGGFSVCAVLGALVGARVSRKANSKMLSYAFIVMLVLVGTFTGLLNVPALWAMATR